jgi:hypothetical protein
MKFIFLILFTFNAYPQAACIFQGNDTLCMKPNLKFQISNNRISSGDPDDPMTVPKAGIPGDLYIRSITGQHYIKTDSGTTLNWNILTTGVDYVVGPAASIDNNLPVYDGITGKLIKDSGVSINDVATASATTANYLTAWETTGLKKLREFNSATNKLYMTANALHLEGSTPNAVVLSADATRSSLSFGRTDSAIHTANNGVDWTNDTLKFQILGPTTLHNESWHLPSVFPKVGQALAVGSIATPTVNLLWKDLGDVVGPASSTDNHLVVYDGITGKLIKDSGNVSALSDGLSFRSNGFDLDVTSSPALTENYQIVLPSDAPAVDQILQSDATGQLSWIDIPPVIHNTSTQAGVFNQINIPTDDGFQLLQVASLVDVVLDPAPFAPILINGMEVTVYNNGTTYITFVYADVQYGALVNGDAELPPQGSITFIYSLALERWEEKSRSF